jgi:hypothetical protein
MAEPHSRPVAAKSNQDSISYLARAQLGMLVVQFLAGMALNLIGSPTSSVGKTSETLLLILHAVIAVGLVVGAIRIAIAAAPSPRNMKIARAAAVAIGVALIGGVLTLVGPLSELWSYIMSIGFIAAFVLYGRLYTLTAFTREPGSN